jgi:hypothetical protein
MKLTEKEIKEVYLNVLTTKKVEEIIEKQNKGFKIKKEEHIWFDNQIGVRREKLNFAMSSTELEEYTKCKMNIQYFANNYCQIKREDGTIGPMVLRDYQTDILDLYNNNRYSILMASRQSGKCLSFSILVNVKDQKTNIIYNITIGELYYNTIKLYRKLTILENVKLILYKILSKIN